jgi:PhnB protein
MTKISPRLTVPAGSRAIEFYEAAFSAKILCDLDRRIAALSIDGAEFFLAEPSPEYGTRAPASAGFTTVRIELFVDDPVAVERRALAAGAARSAVIEVQTAS